ncbi:MAG: BON domain-containing protein [Rhizobacter sp.]|nr:BON domain-containing protein [Bacteriovorax sp.]
MNRKQGQSQRMQGTQSSFSRGSRTGMNQNSQYGRNSGQHTEGIDNDFDLSGSRSQRGLQSGLSSSDDSYETGRGYRDTDYDLDGSTYGSSRTSASLNGRSPSSYSSDSSYGSDYGDVDSNDRARFSQSRDENRSSYDSSFGRYAGSQGDRGLNRQASSSERFGYPSNMNAWSGSERSFNSGKTPGRMGQSSWSAQDSDSDMSYDNSVGNNDWGSSQSYASHTSPSRSGSQSQSWSQSHFGKGPKGYKRSDDRIKEEVCETLARNPRIDASDIEVEVSDAMVTLSGTVDSKDIRRAAEMAIENLSGVDDVKNEIRVKKSDSTSMSMSNDASSTSGSSSSSMGSKAGKTSTDSSSSKGSSRI